MINKCVTQSPGDISPGLSLVDGERPLALSLAESEHVTTTLASDWLLELIDN